MALNRSRTSSSANPNSRSNASNAPSQTPKQKHQRTRRGSTQAAHSPASTPVRQVNTAREDIVQTTRTPEPTGETGMAPAERYYKNLRVLRRRDSHIVSIFDQFAHVTVYYMQDDLSMERAGYEGTLFFFERDIEPKYGLFILNRQGMNDYIRYLLHDDVFEPMGDAVWISTLMPSSPNAMGDEDKTAGFWAMAMDVRETLGDMMMRLAPYIRRGERYPDEFRYGPDRAVPQQNYFAGGTRDDVKHDFLRDLPDEMREKIIKTVQTAKAKAQADEDAVVESGQNNAAGSKTLPPTQSNMSSLDQLFSKLASSETLPSDSFPCTTSVQESLTGKALLDTLFASVSTSAIQPTALGQKLTLQQLGLAPLVSSPPANMEIISPKPSTAGLPQILTTNVIDELLGLPSSDSRSASRSSTSASIMEHPRSPSSAGAHRSKERGYVADFGEDDGLTSEASTNVDLDNQIGENILERLLPGTRTTFLSSGNNVSTGSMKGDATPRARVEQLEHMSPPTKTRPDMTHTVSAGLASAANKKDLSQPKAGSRALSASSAVRAPFQSSAELWSSGVSHSKTASTISNGTDADANEVVELDFSEIDALDDMKMFDAKSAAGLRKKARGEIKPKINGTAPVPNGVHLKEVVPPKQNGIVSLTKRERESNGSKPTASGSQASSSAQPTNIRRDIVEHSLHKVLMESGLVSGDGQPLSRNAFVREVLTRIHTDSSFVDKMYSTYQDAISNHE